MHQKLKIAQISALNEQKRKNKMLHSCGLFASYGQEIDTSDSPQWLIGNKH